MSRFSSTILAALFFISFSSTTLVRGDDYEQLMIFYNSTNSTWWVNVNNWANASVGVCSWYGISCNPNGQVTGINLAQNNVGGSLPDNFNIPTLTQFSVYGNTISGTIPESWSIMGGLTGVNVGDNQFSGPLPDSWSGLTSLLIFRAENNQFTGPLPSSWSALINIQEINVDFNQLSGSLPTSWSNLQNLTALKLSNNAFSGSIPQSWANLPPMTMLLNNNSLSGWLPAGFPMTTSSTAFSLNIAGNPLTGVIDTLFWAYVPEATDTNTITMDGSNYFYQAYLSTDQAQYINGASAIATTLNTTARSDAYWNKIVTSLYYVVSPTDGHVRLRVGNNASDPYVGIFNPKKGNCKYRLPQTGAVPPFVEYDTNTGGIYAFRRILAALERCLPRIQGKNGNVLRPAAMTYSPNAGARGLPQVYIAYIHADMQATPRAYEVYNMTFHNIPYSE